MEKVLSHVEVNFIVRDMDCTGVNLFTVNSTLNEAITILSMPSFSPYIASVVPCYELSKMPEEEN